MSLTLTAVDLAGSPLVGAGVTAAAAAPATFAASYRPAGSGDPFTPYATSGLTARVTWQIPLAAGDWEVLVEATYEPDPPVDPPPESDTAAVTVTDPAAELAALARSPWPERVTLTSVRTAGDIGPAVLYADGCYRLGVKQVVESAGVYQVGDVRFTLPNPLPGSLGDPKPRDVVTWKGTAYTVLDVTGSDWYPSAPFWAVTGRSPKIAYDLRETLTLKRPASQPGAGGLRAVTSWATVWAGDGRLQITDTDAEPETAGLHATRDIAAAYLSATVPARAGDVIDQADGTRWEVVGQVDYDALGLLTTVKVTRLT